MAVHAKPTGAVSASGVPHLVCRTKYDVLLPSAKYFGDADAAVDSVCASGRCVQRIARRRRACVRLQASHLERGAAAPATDRLVGNVEHLCHILAEPSIPLTSSVAPSICFGLTVSGFRAGTNEIKPRRTDHILSVVLWLNYHGEGSVSPSASAKLGLQPLALPRHHPACAMPIQSGSRTCGTSFDSCATKRTCRKCKQSPMGCPIRREYVFAKRSHHV